jgi:hypothetical protein
LVSELLIYEANKEARKTKHDFNPLPRIETSSIRVSRRKLGLHRASPFLRDSLPPSPLCKERPEQAAFFIPLFYSTKDLSISVTTGVFAASNRRLHYIDGNIYGD